MHRCAFAIHDFFLGEILEILIVSVVSVSAILFIDFHRQFLRKAPRLIAFCFKLADILCASCVARVQFAQRDSEGGRSVYVLQ